MVLFMLFLYNKIHNVWGDLTSISGKTKSLKSMLLIRLPLYLASDTVWQTSKQLVYFQTYMRCFGDTLIKQTLAFIITIKKIRGSLTDVSALTKLLHTRFDALEHVKTNWDNNLARQADHGKRSDAINDNVLAKN